MICGTKGLCRLRYRAQRKASEDIISDTDSRVGLNNRLSVGVRITTEETALSYALRYRGRCEGYGVGVKDVLCKTMEYMQENLDI